MSKRYCIIKSNDTSDMEMVLMAIGYTEAPPTNVEKNRTYLFIDSDTLSFWRINPDSAQSMVERVEKILDEQLTIIN